MLILKNISTGMNRYSISKIARALAIFTISLFVLESCKKELSTIGSEFLKDEMFGTGIFRSVSMKAFTTEDNTVVTSKSVHNLLGSYQDPIFGMVRSTFGIQLSLSVDAPDFGTNPIIDSVILTMPYLGRSIGDSIINYETDSIYGNRTIPMQIKISEMIKFLHPDSTYYSNIEIPAGPQIYENLNFVSNLDSLTLLRDELDEDGKDTTIVTKIPAAFRVPLDNTYFQEKILNQQGTSVLADNANFIPYMNGLLYSTTSTDGAVYTFDMYNGTSLMIYYKNEDKDEDGDPLPQQTYSLLFESTFARVNKYEFDRTNADASLLAQLGGDTLEGSDAIYLQGMSGLEGNVKLFTDEDQLKALRDSNWLINQADLVYRVSYDNGDAVAPPYRLLMANVDSLVVGDYRLIDQVVEPIAYDGALRSDQTILGGGETRYYKFRITNHVAAILDGELVLNSEGNPTFDEDGNPIIVYDDSKNYGIKLIALTGKESPSRVKLNSNKKPISSPDAKNLFLEIKYSTKKKKE